MVGSITGTEFAELMTADYSQIEMRIAGAPVQDDGLIEAFPHRRDLHSFVASRAFGVPIDEVTAELRRRVQAMSYGLAYGLSAYGLAAQLKISTEEAKGPDGTVLLPVRRRARDYLEGVVDQARKDGYLDGAGPPPLPTRTRQQQPAGPEPPSGRRSTRRSRAARRTSSRSR